MDANGYVRKLVKWFVVSLLAAVMIFCVFVYQVKFGKKPDDDLASATELIPTQTETDKNTEKEPESIFYSSLPRAASRVNEYVYQNCGGYNEERLLDAFALKEYNYVLLTTNSNNCDFTADSLTYAVAKMNSSLELCQTKLIAPVGGEKYLASSYYDNGYVFATSDTTSTTLYAVNDEMEVSYIRLDYPTDTAILYYIDGGLLAMLSCQKSVNAVILSQTLKVTYSSQFSFDSPVTPMKVLPNSNGYDLFMNTDNGFCCFSLDSVLTRRSFVKLSNDEVVDIVPISDGYLALCNRSGTYSIRTYDMAFLDRSTSEIGKGDGGEILYAASGFFVIVYDSLLGSKAAFVCMHGDITIKYNNDFSSILKVTKICVKTDKTIFIARVKTYGGDIGIAIFDYTEAKNTELYKVLDSGFSLANAKLLCGDDKLYCYFDSISNTGAFVSSFGSSDIFAMSIPYEE